MGRFLVTGVSGPIGTALRTFFTFLRSTQPPDNFPSA